MQAAKSETFPWATAANTVPFQAIARQKVSIPLVCDVQVIPSGLVITRLPVPVSDTAAKTVPFQAIAYHSFVAAAVRPVHVIPSGEVWTRCPS